MGLAVPLSPCIPVACLWVLKNPDAPASKNLELGAGEEEVAYWGGHGAAVEWGPLHVGLGILSLLASLVLDPPGTT